MTSVNDKSIDLIITSPPYPMIEMWDELFFEINPGIKEFFGKHNFYDAFNLMHEELNKTWKECERVLKDGGLICINIGDATRTLNKNFQLWSNHTIINYYFIHQLKLHPLPVILWRKSTNKPNKFMGSGMLAPNAYVTLEHEYILIFRKGNKRIVNDNINRYQSAYFWEERNNWFSDIWFDLKGIKQNTNGNSEEIRERSGAFPLELAYRLINMYSIYHDTILDPFWGTGTSSIAAMISKRNSIGYELNKYFTSIFENTFKRIKNISHTNNTERYLRHIEFIEGRKEKPKHKNIHYGFDVITSQEKQIKFSSIITANDVNKDTYEIKYIDYKFDVERQTNLLF